MLDLVFVFHCRQTHLIINYSQLCFHGIIMKLFDISKKIPSIVSKLIDPIGFHSTKTSNRNLPVFLFFLFVISFIETVVLITCRLCFNFTFDTEINRIRFEFFCLLLIRTLSKTKML